MNANSFPKVQSVGSGEDTHKWRMMIFGDLWEKDPAVGSCYYCQVGQWERRKGGHVGAFFILADERVGTSRKGKRDSEKQVHLPKTQWTEEVQLIYPWTIWKPRPSCAGKKDTLYMYILESSISSRSNPTI